MNAVVEARMPIMSVVEMTERINAIQQVTRTKMLENVHFGVIPGTDKPTLFKAGSEMLLTMFSIAVAPTVLDLSGPDRFRYRVTASGIHVPTQAMVGQGLGECSSDEDRYRWRSAICIEEFQSFPESERRIKWGRAKGGGYYKAEQVRTNPADIGNTVLKMAKKRAQIDMTLTALGVSDLFNQDIEDMPPELRQGGDDGPGASMDGPAEHAGMKAAKTMQELAKIMTSLKQDEKKRYAAYFNVRSKELQEGSK